MMTVDMSLVAVAEWTFREKDCCCYCWWCFRSAGEVDHLLNNWKSGNESAVQSVYFQSDRQTVVGSAASSAAAAKAHTRYIVETFNWVIQIVVLRCTGAIKTVFTGNERKWVSEWVSVQERAYNFFGRAPFPLLLPLLWQLPSRGMFTTVCSFFFLFLSFWWWGLLGGNSTWNHFHLTSLLLLLLLLLVCHRGMPLHSVCAVILFNFCICICSNLYLHHHDHHFAHSAFALPDLMSGN